MCAPSRSARFHALAFSLSLYPSLFLLFSLPPFLSPSRSLPLPFSLPPSLMPSLPPFPHTHILTRQRLSQRELERLGSSQQQNSAHTSAGQPKQPTLCTIMERKQSENTKEEGEEGLSDAHARSHHRKQGTATCAEPSTAKVPTLQTRARAHTHTNKLSVPQPCVRVYDISRAASDAFERERAPVDMSKRQYLQGKPPWTCATVPVP